MRDSERKREIVRERERVCDRESVMEMVKEKECNFYLVGQMESRLDTRHCKEREREIVREERGSVL